MAWLYFALLSALADSLIVTFCKSGLEKIDPLIALSVRFGITTIVLIGLIIGTSSIKSFSISDLYSPSFKAILLTGILNPISYIFYTFALKQGYASKVNAVDQASYLFILLLSALVLKEKITGSMIIGTLFIIFGAYLSI